ncbi:MAG: ABC transporter ATP-binding protein [Frankiaceae bacterium]
MRASTADPAAAAGAPAATDPGAGGIAVDGVSRDFGDRLALDDVTLHVPPGSVHALLGPNGAGKTTLLRILCGLVDPASGRVRIDGLDATADEVEVRRRIGFVPSGDRSFYLRLSGHENLVFFARLHGMRRRAAGRRATEVLEQVGLADAGHRRVGLYSHGMHKRLSVARALLMRPGVLLVDEATHDLDPEGTMRVQALVRAAADEGAAVLWTTQRLDEIRGFADRVTLLSAGRVRFAGSVPQLMALAGDRHYVLELSPDDPALVEPVAARMPPVAALRRAGTGEQGHWVLHLTEEAVLGRVIIALQQGGIDVRACREQRSGLELAFLALTEEP